VKVLGGLLALVTASTALAAGSARSPWRPSMGAAIRYASQRHGVTPGWRLYFRAAILTHLDGSRAYGEETLRGTLSDCSAA